MVELQYYLSNVPEALIYGLLAMGIYISLRILDIPDLTTEGSFGIGAVISVLVSLNGHPILAVFAGMAAGMIAGLITGALQTKLNVHPVLAGIITMSGLYSINLVCYSLTDKGQTTNLSYGKVTIFEKVKETLGIRGMFETSMVKAGVSFIIALVVILLVIWFFKTHLGLNVDRTKIVGLMMANGLIGLSGALQSQSISYADISLQNGTLIYGLAAVIIGEVIFGKRSVATGIVSAVIGSVLYKIIVAFVIRQQLFGDMSSNLMKFTCALIVAITLAVPAIKERMAARKIRKGAM